ncbi:putative Late nodulin [Medicago truncatula]|uniref:Putative Late nodulin n=1 Tax=Medicago truncatula TaxID=3880 RepID=G7L318_MEDTR|nr:Ripening related protein family [Medicago truncatula]RHN44299.1 putative Late nodulin [Medicago truncatula]
MPKSLKFVYTMILFIFLFLITKNVDALHDCEYDDDCPKSTSKRTYRCINKKCRSYFTRVEK